MSIPLSFIIVDPKDENLKKVVKTQLKIDEHYTQMSKESKKGKEGKKGSRNKNDRGIQPRTTLRGRCKKNETCFIWGGVV